MAKDSGKSTVAEAIRQQLKDPFAPNLVKFTGKGGGSKIAYIDARDVQKRLDDVMGIENWKTEIISCDGGSLCKLSLKIEGEWITKTDGAENTKIAAFKGGISGALKRAAVQWGVGRHLYYFDLKKFNFSEHNRDGDWPEIFLPGAPADWEETAQKKYGYISSVEEGGDVHDPDKLEMILACTTSGELEQALSLFSAEDERQFTDAINNKLDELNNNEQSTDK